MRRTFALLAAQALAQAIALTWPAVLEPGRRLLGSADTDTLKHLWTLAWLRGAFAHGETPFHTALLNHPAGLDLWPIEPLNGFCAALAGPVSLVAVANLLAIGNLALTGTCTGLLGWELSERRAGAHLAALLLPTGSFALFAIHVGVGELQHLWLLPLGAWALLRALRLGGLRTVVPAGLALGASAFVCFYYAFFLAIAALTLASAALVAPTRRAAWPRLLAVGGLALALALPASLAFRSAYGSASDLPVAAVASLGAADVEPESARLQPEHLLFGEPPLPEPGIGSPGAYVGGRFLGLPLLVLAGLGIARRPREGASWAAAALLGVVLALGSRPSGALLAVLPADLRLPFDALNRALVMGLEPLNFPVRFLALTSVCLVALAALGLRGAPRAWLPWFALAGLLQVADIQARQALPWPLTRFTPPDLACLADAPLGEGAVLDLSAAWWGERPVRARVLLAQVAHRRPIQAVPIERVELYDREGKVLADALPLVWALRDWSDADPAGLPPAFPGDHRRDLWLLGQEGFAGILALAPVNDDEVKPHLRAALDEVAGPAVAACGPAALYAVPEVVATPDEARAWRAGHAAALARARDNDVLSGR